MSKAKIKRPEIVQDLQFLKLLVMRSTVDWYVIHTNPKCERRAHDGLIAKGILAYLPLELVERVMPKGGKTYTSKKPLFARYLFAGIDRKDGQSIDDIRACDGVEGLVSVEQNGAPVKVSKAELLRVIDVAHGTFEGEPVPDGFIAEIAKLPEGSMLALVKGCWKGLDFAFTGYSEAKQRVRGVHKGKAVRISIDVPLDAVQIK